MVITTPTTGSLLTAGATYTVSWQGGSPISNVALLLMCSDCGDQYTAFTGFGIPSTSIANTQSFSWTMTAGIPSSTTYTLLLVSMSDASNFDISGTFSVDGMVTGYTWALGQFGPHCSKPCGGGTWTRYVACHSSSGRAHVKSGEHVASTHVCQCACTFTTTVLFLLPLCMPHRHALHATQLLTTLCVLSIRQCDHIWAHLAMLWASDVLTGNACLAVQSNAAGSACVSVREHQDHRTISCSVARQPNLLCLADVLAGRSVDHSQRTETPSYSGSTPKPDWLFTCTCRCYCG